MDANFNNYTEITDEFTITEQSNDKEDDSGGHRTRGRKEPSMYETNHVKKIFSRLQHRKFSQLGTCTEVK